MSTFEPSEGTSRQGRVVDTPNFNPKTATEYEIAAKAELLRGRSLSELADSHWAKEASSAANKGGAGAIIERYFSISPNSEQLPDFESAGIELKVCPLVMDGAHAKRIKERTSVTMIDYNALDRETWINASVLKKIRRVLFVFYEWRPDVPLGDLRVRSCRIWSPPDDLLPYLKQDWLAVWRKNHEGRAHEISESDGRILGAATKGATGALRPQPHHTEPAKSRAWSLKPKLTWTIYSGTQADNLERELLRELCRESPTDPVEALLRRFEPFVGMTVGEVANRHGIEPGRGKSRVSAVLRRSVGLSPKKLPAELEALGMELKTIPLGPSAWPHEAMSFPAFDPRELAGEEWEDSELLANIQNVLLVPTYREKRKSDLLNQQVCRPFRWAAEREQLAGIRLEWELYRDLVSQGRIDRLPSESETRFIHVRPHGKDASDRVEAPGGLVVVKQCFWLNREFVRELVLSHNSDWQGF